MTGSSDVPEIAPSVKVCTADGQYVRLRRTPTIEVMDLIESIDDVEVELLSFDLDNGRSQVHVRREAIVRVDVDWELGWWSRFTSWLLSKADRWL